jgi:hypothetical protein
MSELPEKTPAVVAEAEQPRLEWSEPRLQKLRGREALLSDTGSNDGNIISFS